MTLFVVALASFGFAAKLDRENERLQREANALAKLLGMLSDEQP